MRSSFTEFVQQFLKWDSLQIRRTDIVEVIILSFLIYQVMAWIKPGLF